MTLVSIKKQSSEMHQCLLIYLFISLLNEQKWGISYQRRTRLYESVTTSNVLIDLKWLADKLNTHLLVFPLFLKSNYQLSFCLSVILTKTIYWNSWYLWRSFKIVLSKLSSPQYIQYTVNSTLSCSIFVPFNVLSGCFTSSLPCKVLNYFLEC